MPEQKTDDTIETYLIDSWSLAESLSGGTLLHRLASFPGPIKPFKTFLKKHVTAATIDQRNKDGDTALMLAVRAGLRDKAEVLVAAGASVAIANNEADTPLSYACSHDTTAALNDILRILLASPTAGAALAVPGADGHTLLDTAILGNDVLLMKTLLNAKASPNQSNAHGATPLNTLIQSKLPSRLETLKLSRLSILLDAGASVGGHDKKGHSLLRKAASAGAACSIGADFIKRIITAGANPWVPDGDSVTPFEAAVRAKASDDVLLAMLEVNTLAASATVDKCVGRLLSSLKEGNEALAIAMLKAGANVSLPDSSGESALKYICMSAEPAVASRMVPHLQCDTATLGRHTEQLVEAGRVETLRILQQAGARLYWLCALSEYPLMLACKQPAAIELVKVLLDAGMPLTDRNSEGRTVLFYAVDSGKPALVRLLLDRGANLRAVDHQGMTVLMLHSCVEVVEALLERLAKWPRRRKMTTT